MIFHCGRITSADKLFAQMVTQEAGTTTHRIVDALTIAGFRFSDGWFYPAGDPDRALVKIGVGEEIYQICRRRKPHTGWIVIATALVEEFSAEAFETWHQTWPLSC